MIGEKYRPRWCFISPFQLRLKRGIESYVWNLTLSLSRSGVDVEILTWQGSLNVPDYITEAGIKVRIVPGVRYYQECIAVPFYIFALIKGHYDHVFINFADYGEGPAIRSTWAFLNPPFSVVFHFPRSLVPHRYREFDRWDLPGKAKHLIAVSSLVAGEVKDWSGRPCAQIGHGVNTQHFQLNSDIRMSVRTKLKIPQNAYILASVAALEERKGIQWVLRALPEILCNCHDTYYIIVGEGSYRIELEKLVKDLELKERVLFIGEVLDVVPYLNAADILMCLSRGEASSIVSLEAAACCLPVIASQRPPYDEIIKSTWGILVDEQNISSVAQTVVGLLISHESRYEKGIAARKWVIEHHNWDHVAVEYRHLVE
jgi:glycosyltransferase involved in cell wall biosynthesis